MILIRIIQFTFLCFFVLILLTGCDSEPDKNDLGIYYWKTSFKLSKEDKNYLTETGFNKLYLRFFDVDWNPEISSPVPVGEVSIDTKDVPNIEVIPVVFITNRTLKNIPNSSIAALSQNIHKKIFSKLALFENLSINEIQLDCDWSESSKENYFLLLKSLNTRLDDDGIILSATIRLHQVKYFKKTGVPPVDKGMVMLYNISDVSDINTENSIYNEKVAKKYLVNFDEYPLQLDVVLPAFSWIVQFRNGKIIDLIKGLNIQEVDRHPEISFLSKNTFILNKNIQIDNHFLLKGDLFRIESVSTEDTKRAAEIVSDYLKENVTVAFYHFNKEFENNYDKETIEEIISFFN